MLQEAESPSSGPYTRTMTSDRLDGTASTRWPGQLRHVAMRRPGAILTADPRALALHQAHRRRGPERPVRCVRGTARGRRCHHPLDRADADDGLADSVFTYDPSFTIPAGVVILRPGKAARDRRGRAAPRASTRGSCPSSVLIEAPGTVEGGDCFWLDATTIAVGPRLPHQPGRHRAADGDRGAARHHRRGLRHALVPGPRGLPAPAVGGEPARCRSRRSSMPRSCRWRSTSAWRPIGYELLHVPEDEFEASAGLNLNVLPTRTPTLPRHRRFPTRRSSLMVAAGCDVTTFEADELCLPCEGGPTCLTRPLHRL